MAYYHYQDSGLINKAAAATSSMAAAAKFNMSDYNFKGYSQNFIKRGALTNWGVQLNLNYVKDGTQLPFCRPDSVPTHLTPSQMGNGNNTSENGRFVRYLTAAKSLAWASKGNTVVKGEGLYITSNRGVPMMYLGPGRVIVAEVQAYGGDGGAKYDPAVGYQRSGGGGGGGSFCRVVVDLGANSTYDTFYTATTYMYLCYWPNEGNAAETRHSTAQISIQSGRNGGAATKNDGGAAGAGGGIPTWKDGTFVSAKSTVASVTVVDYCTGANGGKGGKNGGSVTNGSAGGNISKSITFGGMFTATKVSKSGGISSNTSKYCAGGGGGACFCSNGASSYTTSSNTPNTGGGGAGQGTDGGTATEGGPAGWWVRLIV